MLSKRLSPLVLILILLAANVATPLRIVAFPDEPDLAARLAAIEKAIEDKRKELGVPGLSLVIVKDDKVIYLKGLGLKDIERKLPVTPDTLFAIGSCTKAFTAMAAVMSAEEGKLSLDDSPKKYLPYFKLQDPEANAKITIRDLLRHNSGLDRTDLIWYTGVLTREEVIKAMAFVKPTAKFREKFQYQNVMYAAAGEVLGKANKSTWEKVIVDRLFKPLGMKASNTSVKETLRSPDFATGYNLKDKKATRVPMRELPNIAPAGAINSNARDLAAWLRLMLSGGLFEGKRLVSEKGFDELVSEQTKIGGKTGYGLGWMLGEWKGHKVISHGGGIDGFNSLVALMPDQKLGFAVLTNVSSSTLPLTVQEAIWSNLVGQPEAIASAPAGSVEPAVDPKEEVGLYNFVQANMKIEIVFKDGQLTAIVPGQPNYPLINVGGRRYKFGPPAPDGFFMTFRPVKGKEGETEMYLEQPHGNYVLPKLKADEVAAAAAAAANYTGPLKELLGSYERDGITIELALKDGKVALVVPGQPTYPLVEKEKDTLGATTLPDSYRIIVKRDEAGKVSGLLLKQPNGDFDFKRVAEATTAVSIPVDELMAKIIEAAGGEANLRRNHSMVITATVELENQGMTGEQIVQAKAPNLVASHLTLVALGKKIGWIREYFDGQSGGTETSFSPLTEFTDRLLENARINADFYAELNWKKLYKTVVIKAASKLGDEDVYVLVKTPEKGDPVTDYISAKSYLLLKRERLIPLGAVEGSLPMTESFSDYRLVEGVMIPFKTVTKHPTMGNLITQVKDVKFNVDIPDTAFRPQTKKP